MGTAVVQMMAKAEKISTTKIQPGQDPKTIQNQLFREVDDSIVVFLKARMEFHRLISHVEAKLQGKAEEMESLETYVRTQPKLGSYKKRKHRHEEEQQQEVKSEGSTTTPKESTTL
jgi:hypothetical protein